MTCCIAAICDDGDAIVLVADKMIGAGFVESQPDIQKVIKVHRDWWVMFAGDDISPVFEITDLVRNEIERRRSLYVENVEEAVEQSYESARIKRAIYKYLNRWHMDVDKFVASGRAMLGKRLFTRTRRDIRDFNIDLELIVAGFDRNKEARIFSVDREGNVRRQDLPGFCAIGSGSLAAEYIMMYRGELCNKSLLREAIFYALEGKYFGEQASGVGTRTDMFILRAGKKPIAMDEDYIEDELFPLCYKLEPGELDKHPSAISVLNAIPLKGVRKIEVEKKKKKKRKPIPKPPSPKAKAKAEAASKKH